MVEGRIYFISLYCTSAVEKENMFGVLVEVLRESSQTTLFHTGDFRVVAFSHPAVQEASL